VATLTVEQASEHARIVDSREAQPVDPAVASDQCDRFEVTDDPVGVQRFETRHCRGGSTEFIV
jgi:hypothetical protein